MVSFECSQCNDTLKKPKLMQHLNRCRYAQFTCIDCNVTFEGTGFSSHTSCISEDQKYQKSVYKAPKAKGQQQQQQQQHQLPPHLTSLPTPPAPSVPAPAPVAPVASTSNGIHPERQRLLDAANGGANKKRAREEPVTVIAPVVVAPVVVEEKKEKKDKKEKKEKKEKAAKLAAAEALVEQIEAAVGGEVEVDTTTEDAPPAKKSKKELKQEKFAKKGSTTSSETVVVAAIPAPVVVVAPVSAHPISVHGQQAAHIPPPSFDLSTLSKPYTLPTFLTAIYPTLLGKSTSLASIRDIVVSEAKAAGFKEASVVEKAFLEGIYIGGSSYKKSKTEMKF